MSGASSASPATTSGAVRCGTALALEVVNIGARQSTLSFSLRPARPRDNPRGPSDPFSSASPRLTEWRGVSALTSNSFAGFARILLAMVGSLDEPKMVEKAAEWAEQIVAREHRGKGDTVEAATHRAARSSKVPESLFIALRYPYRQPKTVSAGVFVRLMLAAHSHDSIEARLERELMLADAAGLNAENSAIYRVAAAALGKKAGREPPGVATRRE